MTLEPIGIFHADAKHPYEARRQAAVDTAASRGEVRLDPRRGYEQALEDLEGFERIWLIFQFDRNPEWKPKVRPPRGPRAKRGVFATRAPYRPNALGLSCVRLIAVCGLTVVVEGHDLLDQTPVFDIKPYLPYADAFPASRVGWLEHIETERWRVEFSARAELQLGWLEAHGVTSIREFLRAQLEFDPLDRKRKRLSPGRDGAVLLAYRTWRAEFVITDRVKKILRVVALASGYPPGELFSDIDPHADKLIHRKFASECLGES